MTRAGLIAILLIAGCGKKMPEFGLVEGTVRVNGQTHAGIVVRFMPDPNQGNNQPSIGIGKTDAQGKYTLQHVYDGKEAPGAAVGWNRVVLEDASHGPTPQGQAPPPLLFSQTYSSPATTPLSNEVKAGTQIIDLDVK